MQIRLIALKFSTTDLAKSNTRTMIGVDIRSNLENKSSELILIGLYIALLSLGRLGTRSYLDEAVEQLLHTEVI